MDFIALERSVTAANYDPLPVVLTEAKGVWVTDTEGRRYLDMMSAYSAVSLGHGHPRILNAMMEQASRLAVTSRAYHTDVLGPFLERLVQVTGLDMALPMNTGAEAVETAIKAARRWGYRVKKHRRRTAPRSSSPRTTSTAAPPPSSASPRSDSTATGFGPFAPRLQPGAASATPGARARDHAEHLRRPDRADPGRGRHRGAAGGLPARAARTSATATTCC